MSAPFERPQERAIARRPGFSSIDALVREQLRAPVDRIEQLERELAALLAAFAPKTWSSNRRPFTRVLRAARRELRARERRTLTGEPS